MKPILPVLRKDFYKAGHIKQYPNNTELVYSNFTPRGTHRDGGGIGGVIAFGYQYLVLSLLIEDFNREFFQKPREVVVKAYQRRMDTALGPGMDCSHIGALHDLGYLPLHVKAVPEGTFIPYRVPVMTIRNTKPEFFWLTNMLETIISLMLWKMHTSATTAFAMRRVFEDYAEKTGADKTFVKWQGHDFSMRGMSGLEDACMSGAAHLLSYFGTDTIPAIDFLENYYGANADSELIGGSVPATEHSVMCMGLEDGEFETFKRLITETYPKGIVSIVSDTWDFWQVLTEYLPRLKESILAREGKVVIRPDSGDPVKIICGDPDAPKGSPEHFGAVELLWRTFGGAVTDNGYIVLDSHIGLIYGDSISPARQKAILQGLMDKGFASSNVVLGVGSYTYEFVTRDTDGFAMKATYGEVNGKGQAIFKLPKTDDGQKNSAKGLLVVTNDYPDGLPHVIEDVSWATEGEGLLQTIFLDGTHSNFQTLAQIRERVEAQL